MLFTTSVLAALSALAAAAPAPYLPLPVHGQKSFTTPNGATIRYKEPGKEGICETTPGVNSYSGYVDLGPKMHFWFWFFESRRDPATDPITLWLNGGPGSDSQIGLFQEHGPCNISENLESHLNPYSWNSVSNMIYLSQPWGTGFSYQTKGVGSLSPFDAQFVPASVAPADGRWPLHNPLEVDTTELAAMAAFEAVQGILSGMGQLDPKVGKVQPSRVFNLWTESYGGHYGPAFYDYFNQQNDLIRAGTLPGVPVEMNALGIINGIINEKIQAYYYPIMATQNTYGIVAYNKTVYDYAMMAYSMPDGCANQYEYCRFANRSTLAGQAICAEATAMCRDNVEGPYYYYSGRGVYDIRAPYNDPTPPTYFIKYLNSSKIQQAIGVDLNYTDSNTNTYYAFQQSGDFVYPTFLKDLERIVDSGVAVGMFYGDADYICNWFGGQAVSKALKYKYHDEFNAAGYEPFVVDGKEYGETRQYGNFSFTRIYESGHEVPYYQPIAALGFFERLNFHKHIATGKGIVEPGYETHGPANATHTESTPPPIPTNSPAAFSGNTIMKLINGKMYYLDTNGDLKKV